MCQLRAQAFHDVGFSAANQSNISALFAAFFARLAAVEDLWAVRPLLPRCVVLPRGVFTVGGERERERERERSPPWRTYGRCGPCCPVALCCLAGASQ